MKNKGAKRDALWSFTTRTKMIKTYNSEPETRQW